MQYISFNASIGDKVQVGRFTVVEDNVKIGDNCVIGNNVVIHEDTIVGNNVRIDDNTVIGKKPMRSVNSALKQSDNHRGAIIGEECLIGANVVIYCGCEIGEKTLVADLASIRENVSIGMKTIVGRGVAIENHCTIGGFCKLETNCYITAYSELGDRVFVAPGVTTSNDNFAGRSEKRFEEFKGITVKKGGRIGAGATILPGKVIEEDGFVSAGAVVTKDVPARKIVAGCPAKVLRDVPEDQLLENQ